MAHTLFYVFNDMESLRSIAKAKVESDKKIPSLSTNCTKKTRDFETAQGSEVERGIFK